MCHCFAILDYSEDILLRHAKQNIRQESKMLLNKHVSGFRYACSEHQSKATNVLVTTVVNIFFNNKQKQDKDIPRKDGVAAFKRRQRSEGE